MNKSKNKLTFSVILLMALMFIGTLSAEVSFDRMNLMTKPADATAFSMINVGNWTYWVWDDGGLGNVSGAQSGGFYPTLTAAIVYKDGFIWAGYLGDEAEADPEANLIIAGNMYYDGLTKGWIEADGSAVDPNDATVGIYMTRQDWPSLTQENSVADAAEWFRISVDAVTPDQVQEYIDVCIDGWNTWPVEHGAPYYDEDGNGEYNPVDNDGDGNWDIGVFDEETQTYTTLYDRPGLAGADQVVWLALNDLNDDVTQQFFGKAGIGMELQITLWAYNQPTSELGSVIYKKFRLINKSNLLGVTDSIYHMYVGQFVDPDIGASANDYVGCDSVLGIAMAYNAELTDTDFDAFGIPPAAVGYDFFAGPLVPSPGDTAIFDLKKVPDYRNLPMTSFGYFSAGSVYSDPADGDSDFEEGKRQYNLMRGYAPTSNLESPESFTHNSGQFAGNPTNYPLNGDPFLQTGDLDGLGDLGAGDRRMFSGSGPFTMAPGDTQEVVLAVVGGIINEAGGNNRNAVAQMRINDKVAQFLFDNLFASIPRPPAAPSVSVTELENEVVLNWGGNAAAVSLSEADDPVLGFNFQGYNVWQLPSQSPSLSNATKVATFDKADGVTIIRGERFVPAYGDVLTVPLQSGTDTGIQRSFVLTKDYITDKALYNGNTYYFAVTAYNYVDDPSVPVPSLESEVKVLAITPQKAKPGYVYEGTPGEMLDVTQAAGNSQGQVSVEIIDPKAVTGHNYQVYFVEDEDTNSATYGELFWNLRDVSDGMDILENQEVRGSLDDNDQPIIDGIQVKVAGAAPGILQIAELDDTGEIYDANLWGSLNNYGRSQQWPVFLIQALGGDNFDLGRIDRFGLMTPKDYEIIFTDEDSTLAWDYYTDAVLTDGAGNPEFLPVIMNRIDIDGTVTRIPITVLDRDEDGSWTRAELGYYGPAEDPVCWEAFYVYDNAEYVPANVADYIAANDGTVNPGYGPYGTVYPAVNRLLFHMYIDLDEYAADAGLPLDANGYFTDKPNAGEHVAIYTGKPITTDDVFTFTAPGTSYDEDLAKADIKKINVFPNPYYAFSTRSTSAVDQYVTFTHLPERATIRIFNLAGELVRTIEKNSAKQFENWDLYNDSRIPIASGLYIAYIDLPELGKSKVLKFYVIQKEQILKYF